MTNQRIFLPGDYVRPPEHTRFQKEPVGAIRADLRALAQEFECLAKSLSQGIPLGILKKVRDRVMHFLSRAMHAGGGNLITRPGQVATSNDAMALRRGVSNVRANSLRQGISQGFLEKVRVA